MRPLDGRGYPGSIRRLARPDPDGSNGQPDVIHRSPLRTSQAKQPTTYHLGPPQLADFESGTLGARDQGDSRSDRLQRPPTAGPAAAIIQDEVNLTQLYAETLSHDMTDSPPTRRLFMPVASRRGGVMNSVYDAIVIGSGFGGAVAGVVAWPRTATGCRDLVRRYEGKILNSRLS